MTKSNTTWRIPKAAWIMVSLAVVAEATSNALRAYALGSHLERLTVHAYGHNVSLAGAMLVLAAFAVSLSQTRAAWVALTPGDTRQRIVSGLAAALCLSISITAMASHILEAQRGKSGDETADRNGYTDAKAAYDTAIAELAKVKDAETPAQIEAQIEAVAVSQIDGNIWKRTGKCTDITKPASRDECQPVITLRPKLAAAQRKAVIEAELPGLKASLDGQHLTEVATVSEAGVSWAWAWIMGLGVVMIATFGPAIFAKVELAPIAAAVSTKDGRRDPTESETAQTSFPVPDLETGTKLRAFLSSRVPHPVPPRFPGGSGPKGGTRNSRSEPQRRADVIAAELRNRGEVPKFHIVRNEYQRRFGAELPKVTAHRACG